MIKLLKRDFVLLLMIVFVSFNSAFSEVNTVLKSTQVFKIENPDFNLSPKTGVTRKHWQDAAYYLLEGAFGYIHNLDDPMKFPKQPGISYPKKESQVPTEKLEGLCRTLFVAAPLLQKNPDLIINDIKVAEYYRHQIGNLINPESPSYIKHRAKNGGPSQNLVEFGALAISLSAIPEVLWEPLSQGQKDSLAAVMLSYGDGPTVDSNWKFFNIFVLSFFKEQGYKVNEKLLVEYLEKSLKHYRGEGWYNDSPAYDYYSMWAFQMYGAIWSEHYGKKYYPEIAQQFMQNFSDLKDNYPYMFSRDGKMIMYGRSISYRYASVTVFPLMGYENDPSINYGWMRRIASSTLMQFLTHPDFLKDGVPTLGFYGPFEPAVQMYSCRGSVYWGGKVFLGLFIPESNPFWTATENDGAWDNYKNDTVYNKFSKGTNILITDYPSIGSTEIRAWCHEKVASDWQKFRSTENYNRLSYNSAFPWQADGDKGAVAMNYVVKNKENKWEALRLYDFQKFDDGIYYRNAELETNNKIKFQLADIPLSNGILRVDKIICEDSLLQNIQVRLGHYALPQYNSVVKDRTYDIGFNRIKTIDNGEYQLAMVAWKNWGELQYVHTSGLHPQSNASAVINAYDVFETGKKNEKIYVTLELWKKSGTEWTNKELSPVKKVKIAKDGKSVKITFRNKTSKIVQF